MVSKTESGGRSAVLEEQGFEESAATEQDFFYRSLGGGSYESTLHTQGAWNPHEQHMAPVSGIMTRELELCQPRPDLRMARVNFDILGLIPAGQFRIETQIIRGGRTIELLQAELIAEGRVAVRATAWRLQRGDTAGVAAVEEEPMPGVAEAAGWEGMTQWPGGYIASLEIRVVPGHRPGRGKVWIRSPYPMVEGQPTADLVRLMGLVDTANGLAARVPPGPGSYMFPNVDLSVHLHRDPVGDWLGVDTSVTFGTDGIGLTSSVLHDVQGPFGRAAQILTIRRLPEAAKPDTV
ncbi:thioesterase family protein [Paenarthrobacter sp. Z7-10]|uniref:thioesterase family protein n=1 Tax=Paenarthrobacter sp. Z7-10 TaxID=2787635 RepID=UPI0022A9A857|nr:thioesterase family protein [Paenarthrobacter sp. Z7-10]MCZ2402059.1 thioesterase family protein [Paenarthrobacter sp. Z7-10]